MRKFFIIFIFVIALVFRLWNLSNLPTSLSIDEVTFGYAGYSILHTAHDEFGRFLPLAFEGVGDFKPPVDVYLNAISIFILGFNEFAVRLPGVILGSLTSVVLIFLLRELKLGKGASLFGGFWLSISGWHIFFSRAGYESIPALFFLVLGTYFFLKGVRLRKKAYLYFSFVSYSLSVWSYHAERIFVPVLFLFLIFYFRKDLRRIFNKLKDYRVPLVIFIVFALPFLYLLFFSKGISARAVNLWIGNSPHHGSIIEAFVGQYLNYFDLKFLFWDGLGLTPKGFQGVGVFSILDIPLVLAGVYELTKLKEKKFRNLMFFWFLLYPLPGAFARGDPSPIRALVGVPIFTYIVSIGFVSLVKKFGLKFIGIYIPLAVISVFYFFNVYTQLFPKYFADIWNYGYKDVAQYVCKNYSKYSSVIVTDKYGIELPNIKTVPNYYILFHCQWNPSVYLNNKNLYNVEIRQPQWRIDSKLKNALLVGSAWDFPENFDKKRIMKTIYFPNGKVAFYFVETDK